MCSKTSPAPLQADLTARIGRVIDELAAAAAQRSGNDADFADQLAIAWAVIAAADPDLARRAARYTG